MDIGTIIGAVGGIRASALLVLCLILASVSCSRGRAIDRLEGEVSAKSALVKAWENANTMNVVARESLQHANEQWRRRAELNAQAAQLARATLQTQTQALQSELSRAHERRRIIYRDKPYAHAWSTDPVPADVYAGMRDE